jgi:hypothetical protein
MTENSIILYTFQFFACHIKLNGINRDTVSGNEKLYLCENEPAITKRNLHLINQAAGARTCVHLCVKYK